MGIESLKEFGKLPELDAEWVVRDMGNDEDAYRAVADMFLEDLVSMRGSLSRASAGSAAALVPIIHEVANSLGVVGARRGAALVRHTERRLREGGAMSAQEVASVSLQALSDAEGALRSWLLAGGPDVTNLTA